MKIGTKPVMLFSKSIICKNCPKDKLYNYQLGTFHEILPDPNGINGLCHYFESLKTYCPKCKSGYNNRELWATLDYAVAYCNICKFYTWKLHEKTIEDAWNTTPWEKLKKEKKKLIINVNWRK